MTKKKLRKCSFENIPRLSIKNTLSILLTFQAFSRIAIVAYRYLSHLKCSSTIKIFSSAENCSILFEIRDK